MLSRYNVIRFNFRGFQENEALVNKLNKNLIDNFSSIIENFSLTGFKHIMTDVANVVLPYRGYEKLFKIYSQTYRM